MADAIRHSGQLTSNNRFTNGAHRSGTKYPVVALARCPLSVIEPLSAPGVRVSEQLDVWPPRAMSIAVEARPPMYRITGHYPVVSPAGRCSGKQNNS